MLSNENRFCCRTQQNLFFVSNFISSSWSCNWFFETNIHFLFEVLKRSWLKLIFHFSWSFKSRFSFMLSSENRFCCVLQQNLFLMSNVISSSWSCSWFFKRNIHFSLEVLKWNWNKADFMTFKSDLSNVIFISSLFIDHLIIIFFRSIIFISTLFSFSFSISTVSWFISTLSFLFRSWISLLNSSLNDKIDHVFNRLHLYQFELWRNSICEDFKLRLFFIFRFERSFSRSDNLWIINSKQKIDNVDDEKCEFLESNE